MTQPEQRELRIGIWGGPQSGKTHYIHQLPVEVMALDNIGFSIRELKQTDASVTSLEEHLIGGAGQLINAVAISALKKGREFRRRKTWELPTNVGQSGAVTYSFRIHRQVPLQGGKKGETSHNSLLVTMTDAGGEWYRNPKRAWQLHAEEFKKAGQENPLEALMKCDGIVCLFDSQVLYKGVMALDHSTKILDENADLSAVDEGLRPLTRSELPETFRELCEMLHIGKEDRPDGKLAVPIAACLTKVDQPGLWERRNNPDQLEAWARDCYPELPRQITNDCAVYRWFGVSVIGCATNNAGEVVAQVDANNQIPATARVQPCNIVSPILWLASVLSGGHSVWAI